MSNLDGTIDGSIFVDSLLPGTVFPSDGVDGINSVDGISGVDGINGV